MLSDTSERLRDHYQGLITAVLAIIAFWLWFLDLSVYKFNGAPIINGQEALTLLFVEVPVGVAIAWIAAVVIGQGTQRAIQFQSEEAKELRAALTKHYEEVINRMSAWNYYGGKVSPDFGQFVNDETHLKRFKELYQIYLRGPPLAKQDSLKRNATSDEIKSQLRTWFKVLGPLGDPVDVGGHDIETITNQIVNSASSRLNSSTSNPDLEAPTGLHLGGYEFCGVGFKTTLEKITQFYKDCDSLTKNETLRNYLLAERAAQRNLEDNKNQFDAQRNMDFVLVMNMKYYDPRLREAICAGCKPMRDALHSMRAELH